MFEVKENDFGTGKPVEKLKAEDENYEVTVFNYGGDLSVTSKPKKEALLLSWTGGSVTMEVPHMPVVTIGETEELVESIKKSAESAKELEKLIDSVRK